MGSGEVRRMGSGEVRRDGECGEVRRDGECGEVRRRGCEEVRMEEEGVEEMGEELTCGECIMSV